MPVVTALRALPRGRVAVELDGTPWRVLPAEAVVSAHVAVGQVLDRHSARTLRRVLRRLEGLDVATRSLRARDLSTGEVVARLRRASVAPVVEAEVVATLERAGILDDARYAHTRAAALAERGYGDAAIEADLERRGVPPELRIEALERLEPELARAAAVVQRRGPGPRTVRYLAGKGFCEQAVEAAAGGVFASDP